MTKPLLALFAVGLSSLLLANRVHAGSEAGKSSVVAVEQTDPAFSKGSFDLQVMSGALFSVQRRGTYERPEVAYDLGVIRGGYMLDNPYGRGLLGGNDEFMLEAAGGSIFNGPGSGLGGLSLLYRRNFLFPAVQSRLVPYIDLGAGGIYTDAYHTPGQRVLGAKGEFDLQAAFGLRVRLTPRWSLDTEFNFRHLSNANLASRNYGTNGIGGLLGVSRSF